MISRIRIFSIGDIERLISSDVIPNFPWFLISIYGDSKLILTEKNKEILKNKKCKDFLSLEFWDLTDINYKIVKETFPNAILFNKDHAKQILSFVEDINKKEDGVLAIHCDAGISRSGAVGEFINDYLLMSYDNFINANPHIHPNNYILRILKEEARKQTN